SPAMARTTSRPTATSPSQRRGASSAPQSAPPASSTSKTWLQAYTPRSFVTALAMNARSRSPCPRLRERSSISGSCDARPVDDACTAANDARCGNLVALCDERLGAVAVVHDPGDIRRLRQLQRLHDDGGRFDWDDYVPLQCAGGEYFDLLERRIELDVLASN